MKKRILSLILCLTMLVGMMPVNALALESGDIQIVYAYEDTFTAGTTALPNVDGSFNNTDGWTLTLPYAGEEDMPTYDGYELSHYEIKSTSGEVAVTKQPGDTLAHTEISGCYDEMAAFPTLTIYVVYKATYTYTYKAWGSEYDSYTFNTSNETILSQVFGVITTTAEKTGSTVTLPGEDESSWYLYVTGNEASEERRYVITGYRVEWADNTTDEYGYGETVTLTQNATIVPVWEKWTDVKAAYTFKLPSDSMTDSVQSMVAELISDGYLVGSFEDIAGTSIQLWDANTIQFGISESEDAPTYPEWVTPTHWVDADGYIYELGSTVILQGGEVFTLVMDIEPRGAAIKLGTDAETATTINGHVLYYGTGEKVNLIATDYTGGVEAADLKWVTTSGEFNSSTITNASLTGLVELRDTTDNTLYDWVTLVQGTAPVTFTVEQNTESLGEFAPGSEIDIENYQTVVITPTLDSETYPCSEMQVYLSDDEASTISDEDSDATTFTFMPNNTASTNYTLKLGYKATEDAEYEYAYLYLYNTVEFEFSFDYTTDFKSAAETAGVKLTNLAAQTVTHDFANGSLTLEDPSTTEYTLNNTNYVFSGWAMDAAGSQVFANSTITETNVANWAAEDGYVVYALYKADDSTTAPEITLQMTRDGLETPVTATFSGVANSAETLAQLSVITDSTYSWTLSFPSATDSSYVIGESKSATANLEKALNYTPGEDFSGNETKYYYAYSVDTEGAYTLMGCVEVTYLSTVYSNGAQLMVKGLDSAVTSYVDYVEGNTHKMSLWVQGFNDNMVTHPNNYVIITNSSNGEYIRLTNIPTEEWSDSTNGVVYLPAGTYTATLYNADDGVQLGRAMDITICGAANIQVQQNGEWVVMEADAEIEVPANESVSYRVGGLDESSSYNLTVTYYTPNMYDPWDGETSEVSNTGDGTSESQTITNSSDMVGYYGVRLTSQSDGSDEREVYFKLVNDNYAIIFDDEAADLDSEYIQVNNALAHTLQVRGLNEDYYWELDTDYENPSQTVSWSENSYDVSDAAQWVMASLLYQPEGQEWAATIDEIQFLFNNFYTYQVGALNKYGSYDSEATVELTAKGSDHPLMSQQTGTTGVFEAGDLNDYYSASYNGTEAYFAYWYVVYDDGEFVRFGADTDVFDLLGNATIYAVWNSQVELTFLAGNGIAEDGWSYTEMATLDTSHPAPDAVDHGVVAPSGYQFAGWYREADDYNFLFGEDLSDFNEESYRTFVAVFLPEITYTFNPGEGAADDAEAQTVGVLAGNYEETYYAPSAPAAKNSLYTFSHWESSAYTAAMQEWTGNSGDDWPYTISEDGPFSVPGVSQDGYDTAHVFTAVWEKSNPKVKATVAGIEVAEDDELDVYLDFEKAPSVVTYQLDSDMALNLIGVWKVAETEYGRDRISMSFDKTYSEEVTENVTVYLYAGEWTTDADGATVPAVGDDGEIILGELLDSMGFTLNIKSLAGGTASDGTIWHDGEDVTRGKVWEPDGEAELEFRKGDESSEPTNFLWLYSIGGNGRVEVPGSWKVEGSPYQLNVQAVSGTEYDVRAYDGATELAQVYVQGDPIPANWTIGEETYVSGAETNVYTTESFTVTVDQEAYIIVATDAISDDGNNSFDNLSAGDGNSITIPAGSGSWHLYAYADVTAYGNNDAFAQLTIHVSETEPVTYSIIAQIGEEMLTADENGAYEISVTADAVVTLSAESSDGSVDFVPKWQYKLTDADEWTVEEAAASINLPLNSAAVYEVEMYVGDMEMAAATTTVTIVKVEPAIRMYFNSYFNTMKMYPTGGVFNTTLTGLSLCWETVSGTPDESKIVWKTLDSTSGEQVVLTAQQGYTWPSITPTEDGVHIYLYYDGELVEDVVVYKHLNYVYLKVSSQPDVNFQEKSTIMVPYGEQIILSPWMPDDDNMALTGITVLENSETSVGDQDSDDATFTFTPNANTTWTVNVEWQDNSEDAEQATGTAQFTLVCSDAPIDLSKVVVTIDLYNGEDNRSYATSMGYELSVLYDPTLYTYYNITLSEQGLAVLKPDDMTYNLLDPDTGIAFVDVGEGLTGDTVQTLYIANVNEDGTFACDPTKDYVTIRLVDKTTASLTVNGEENVLLTEDEAKQVEFAYSGVPDGVKVALVEVDEEGDETLHQFTNEDNGKVTLAFEHGEHTINLVDQFDGSVLDTVQVDTIYFTVNGEIQSNDATYVQTDYSAATYAVGASVSNNAAYSIKYRMVMLNGTDSGWQDAIFADGLLVLPVVPAVTYFAVCDASDAEAATLTVSVPDTLTVTMTDANNNPVTVKNNAATIDSTVDNTLSISSLNYGVGTAETANVYYLEDGDGNKTDSLTIAAGTIANGVTETYKVYLLNTAIGEGLEWRTITVTGYEEQTVFLTVQDGAEADAVKGDYTCEESVSETFTIGYTTEVADYEESKLVYKYIDLAVGESAVENELTELTQYKTPKNWQINLYEKQEDGSLKLLDSIIVTVNGTTEYYITIGGVPQVNESTYTVADGDMQITLGHNIPESEWANFQWRKTAVKANTTGSEAVEAATRIETLTVPGETTTWELVTGGAAVAKVTVVSPADDLSITIDHEPITSLAAKVDIVAEHIIKVSGSNYPYRIAVTNDVARTGTTYVTEVTLSANTLADGETVTYPIVMLFDENTVVEYGELVVTGEESLIYFTIGGVRQANGKVYDVPTVGQTITVGHNLTAEQQSLYTLYKSEYIGETEITAETDVDWADTYNPTTTAPITTSYVIKLTADNSEVATLTVRMAEDISVKLMDSTGSTEIADVTHSTGDNAVVVDSTEAYQLAVSSALFSTDVFSLSDSDTITKLDIAAGTIAADGTAYKVYVKSADADGNPIYHPYKTITLKGKVVSASESATFSLTNNTTGASQTVKLGDTLYITYNPAVTDDEGNVTTPADTFTLSVSSGTAKLGTSSTDGADATETSVTLAPDPANDSFTYYAWENGYHVDGDSITLNFISNAAIAAGVKLLVGGEDVTFKRLTADEAANVVFSYEGLDAVIPVILTDNGADMNAAFENASWTTALAGGTHEIKLVNAADGAVLDSVSLIVEGAYISLNGQKQADGAIVTVDRTNTTQYVDCVATAAGMDGDYKVVYTTSIGDATVSTEEKVLTASDNSALATAKFTFVPSTHPLTHNYKLYDADGDLACELTIETMNGSYTITLNDLAVALDADTPEDQRATLDESLDYTLEVASSDVSGSYSWKESSTASVTIAADSTTVGSSVVYPLQYTLDGTAYDVGTITMNVIAATTEIDPDVDGSTLLQLMMDGKEITGSQLNIVEIGARGEKTFSVQVSADAGVTLHQDTIRWTYEMYEDANGGFGALVGVDEGVISPTYTANIVAPGYKYIKVQAEDTSGTTHTADATIFVDPDLSIILTDSEGNSYEYEINDTAEVEVGKTYTLTAASETDEFVWQQQLRMFRMARGVTESETDYETYVDIENVTEGYSAAFKLIDEDTQVPYGDFYVVAKEVTDEGGDGSGGEGGEGDGTGGEGGDDDPTGEGDTPMEGHWQNEYVWNDDDPELSEGNVTLIAKDTDFATEPAIYYIELNWGDMAFTAKRTTNRTWDWDPEKHISYKVSESSTTQWLPQDESNTLDLAANAKLSNASDFTQDTILIYNHSNKPVKAVLTVTPESADYGVDFALNKVYGSTQDYTTSGNSYGVTLARGDWNEDDPTASGDLYIAAAATGAKVTPSGTPDADAFPAGETKVIATVTIKLAPVSSGTDSAEDETTTP